MKKLKKWPQFLAVLLILGSAALPYVVSQMQDAFTERKSETRTITAMRLPVGAEQRIGQILQMCAYQNLQMMWDGATNLTAPEVENSIKEAVAQMTQAGLLENVEVADGEAIAYLYVSEKDWQVSTIAWQYTWIDKDMRCYASVDDTTGKLLGILHGDYANGFDGSEEINGRACPQVGCVLRRLLWYFYLHGKRPVTKRRQLLVYLSVYFGGGRGDGNLRNPGYPATRLHYL